MEGRDVQELDQNEVLTGPTLLVSFLTYFSKISCPPHEPHQTFENLALIIGFISELVKDMS